MDEKKAKKKINKKEIKNIAIAGAVGGVAGAGKGVGNVAIDNYKKYNKVKKSYIDKHIDEYIKKGFSKKEAYKRIIEDFSSKKIPLNKIIPEYKGVNKYKVSDAYKIKALNEIPYKAIGGTLVGVPLGMLAYGQVSNIVENLNKKASYDMIYFEKVTSNK